MDVHIQVTVRVGCHWDLFVHSVVEKKIFHTTFVSLTSHEIKLIPFVGPPQVPGHPQLDVYFRSWQVLAAIGNRCTVESWQALL